MNNDILKAIQILNRGGIVIYFKKGLVSPLAAGGKDTIGLRMPDHKIPLEIIKSIGVPILGTSANFSGGQTPYRFEDLDSGLLKKVDFVVRGDCKNHKSSTVIDCTHSPPQLLRQGAIKLSKDDIY